jgi:uncharacterized protein (TIGR00255 family)
MIYSMTGFGDAAAEREGSRYLVEIKSLNNRYFKPSIRLPESISALEAEIESILRKRVGRGSIVYTLKMKAAETRSPSQINREILHSYVTQLAEAGFHVTDPDRLLFLPGVLESAGDSDEETRGVDRHRRIILDLTERAADKLLAMRKQEGESLRQDLMAHTRRIAEHLEGVRGRAGGVVEQYYDKLVSRVNELMAKAELKVAQQDLLKEVAVFAERSDISEELHRLAHHVQQFEDAVTSDDGEHVGRKLDFIAQEMLREANTIGSKANDAEIAGHIVEIKGAIDRLKEQVQNVE